MEHHLVRLGAQVRHYWMQEKLQVREMLLAQEK
jgi:hypothetical protein